MKKLVTILTLLVFLVSVPVAFGRGNNRYKIDQQWKRVEAQQKRQSERFNAIEREAAAMIRGFTSESGSEGGEEAMGRRGRC